MRYVYLGDRMTDPALVGQPCDPVRRADGKCIVSQRFATQLVEFADGSRRVVKRRRLRVQKGFSLALGVKLDQRHRPFDAEAQGQLPHSLRVDARDRRVFPNSIRDRVAESSAHRELVRVGNPESCQVLLDSPCEHDSILAFNPTIDKDSTLVYNTPVQKTGDVMANAAQVARQSKERNPEEFCADPKCLWRIANARGPKAPCPNHPVAPAATTVSVEK